MDIIQLKVNNMYMYIKAGDIGGVDGQDKLKRMTTLKASKEKFMGP